MMDEVRKMSLTWASLGCCGRPARAGGGGGRLGRVVTLDYVEAVHNTIYSMSDWHGGGFEHT